jgi:hypothetical protein
MYVDSLRSGLAYVHGNLHMVLHRSKLKHTLPPERFLASTLMLHYFYRSPGVLMVFRLFLTFHGNSTLNFSLNIRAARSHDKHV